MAGFNVSVEDLKDYKEMLIPPGKYLAEVVGAKEGVTTKGRGKIDLRLRILDTMPAGESFDTDKYLDPIDTQIFTAIYMEKEDDVPRTANMMKKNLSNYIKFFEIEASEPGVLKASDFEGTTGGITVKHERMFKDDPDSEMKATVKSACAIE